MNSLVIFIINQIMNNFKLLCTFSYKKNLNSVIDDIIYQFNGLQKIFVFVNRDNDRECYLTFNIDLNLNDKFSKYIIIHRKKETNTLYSVNALNLIIQNLNNGILDKSYILNWDLYRNHLLLSKGGEVNRIPLELEEVIKL